MRPTCVVEQSGHCESFESRAMTFAFLVFVALPDVLLSRTSKTHRVHI